MIDFGLRTPPHTVSLPETLGAGTAAAWTAMDVPVDSDGRKARFVLLSFSAEPTDLWHLFVQMDPPGDTSAPSSTDYSPLLHGFAHNPAVLDVTGIDRIWVRPSSGTGRKVTIVPLGNCLIANRGPLRAPFKIAADSASGLATDSGVVSTFYPDNAAGRRCKYVLLHWDDPDVNIPWHPTANMSLSRGPNLHGRAHNPMLIDVSNFDRARCRLDTGDPDTRIRYTPLENEG